MESSHRLIVKKCNEVDERLSVLARTNETVYMKCIYRAKISSKALDNVIRNDKLFFEFHSSFVIHEYNSVYTYFSFLLHCGVQLRFQYLPG